MRFGTRARAGLWSHCAEAIGNSRFRSKMTEPACRPSFPPGDGLRTMAYRAQVLEGELTVGPAPGGGTRAPCRARRRPGQGPQRDV